jgi:H+/Cl- antiporter ClcA
MSSRDRGVRQRVRGRWGFASVIVGARRGFWCLVVVVGLASGLVGAGYVEALKYLTRVLGPGGFARPTHLVLIVAVGATIGLLTRVLGSPGDVELLIDNIHVSGGPADVRDLRSLIPISLLGISVGSAIGPEAPLVQTTGSVGSWIALRRRLSVSESRILTVTGMAAGFTVLFGAPLGSAVFALEILHRRGLEYYEALLPAGIGSLAGYLIYGLLTGLGFKPVWHFPEPHTLHFGDLGVGLAAGCAAAIVAVAFIYAAQLFRWCFQALPSMLRPVVGGAALGGLAFATPYALTFGEGQIQVIATAKIVLATLLLAFIVKLIASSMIVSSGWRGGFIIPMFFLGAALGAAAHDVFGVDKVLAMVTLMAAINAGVTKTPFGSTLVVAEMSGLRLLPPVLLASIVALFLTSRVSMIHTQRDRMAEIEPGPGSTPDPNGAASETSGRAPPPDDDAPAPTA